MNPIKRLKQMPDWVYQFRLALFMSIIVVFRLNQKKAGTTVSFWIPSTVNELSEMKNVSKYSEISFNIRIFFKPRLLTF